MITKGYVGFYEEKKLDCKNIITQLLYIILYACTLFLKQFKFPRYNMKCRGKHDTT